MDISQRIAQIREELNLAALERWGRAPEMIAVTKTVEPEIINSVMESGILHIGENRVQELMQKLPSLDSKFQIDMIGRLQNNKVKYIIDKVAMIQSLDRMELAKEIDRHAQKFGRQMPVLIQVNIGNEPQKGGISPDEVLDFAREAAQYRGMRIEGLMAVMPNAEDKETLRPLFSLMRRKFEELQNEAISNTRIQELSMGMSGDYRIAAEEGATHVRIGSAIFGARNYPTP